MKKIVKEQDLKNVIDLMGSYDTVFDGISKMISFFPKFSDKELFDNSGIDKSPKDVAIFGISQIAYLLSTSKYEIENIGVDDKGFFVDLSVSNDKIGILKPYIVFTNIANGMIKYISICTGDRIYSLFEKDNKWSIQVKEYEFGENQIANNTKTKTTI